MNDTSALFRNLICTINLRKLPLQAYCPGVGGWGWEMKAGAEVMDGERGRAREKEEVGKPENSFRQLSNYILCMFPQK